MPSSSFDPWFASRRFAIIIDAGSSGSRLQIYSWRADSHHSQATLPVVERGSKIADDWIVKIQPGISSFSNSPDRISNHLAPLLQHARDYIPPSLHSQTPLFLYATAGMRLLPPKDQIVILEAACEFLRFHSDFRVTDDDANFNPDISGRGGDQVHSPHSPYDIPSPSACKNHVRVISGEEEGLFGWIAVNYLMDAFSSSVNSSSYGFLDMGGASAQIAFKVDPNSPAQSALPHMSVNLNLLNGQSIHQQVFVTTWLGYGTNQARERYVAQLAQAFPSSLNQTTFDIPDPCLPRGLSLPVHGVGTRHNPIIIEDIDMDMEDELVIGEEDDLDPLYLRGTGSFDECLSLSAKLLHDTSSSNSNSNNNIVDNIDSPSPSPTTLPFPFPLPLETTPFVGISEYWYTSEHLFGLGGPYDDAAFENAAKKFCAVDWKNIQFLYLGLSGAGGENENENELLDLDYFSSGLHSKYASKVDVHRLEMQCFKSAWMMNVLHMGLGMPRRSRGERGRKDISSGSEDTEDNAGETFPRVSPKLPMFQSVDTIRDTTISWTLGKMVLEASRDMSRLQIGTSLKQSPPVPHIDNLPKEFSPHRDDHHHLLPPSSPSLSSVLSSPFVLCVYVVALVVLFLISYRLGVWYQCKVALRRWWRKGLILNGTRKLGRYDEDEDEDDDDENDDDEKGREKLEMGQADGVFVPSTGKKPLRLLSSVLSFFSAVKSVSVRSVRPRNLAWESHSMMNRPDNAYNNRNSSPYPFPDPVNSYTHADLNLDYHHLNAATNSNPTRLVTYRSTSLPVSLVSSPKLQPQPQSQFQSSFYTTSYTNSPISLSTYVPLSTASTSVTPTILNMKVSSVFTASSSSTNNTPAATTALTTQPLNHFAQSRSRNSSQVSLAGTGMSTSTSTGGLNVLNGLGAGPSKVGGPVGTRLTSSAQSGLPNGQAISTSMSLVPSSSSSSSLSLSSLSKRSLA